MRVADAPVMLRNNYEKSGKPLILDAPQSTITVARLFCAGQACQQEV